MGILIPKNKLRRNNDESQKELNQNLLKRVRALELSLDDSRKSIERLWKEVNILINIWNSDKD